MADTLQKHANLVSCALTAGAVGGVVNSLIAPVFGVLHITTALGVAIAPPFDKEQAVQAYIVTLKLCIVSARIIPSLVQIFLVFPLTTNAGIGGVKLGILTPLFVLVFNTLGWSLPALLFFNQTGYQDCLGRLDLNSYNPLLDQIVC
eukprot:jgi/Astpho2/7390/Aster-01979